MQFNFWLGNHHLTGQRSLEDVIGIIGHQLQALGHEVHWERANDKLVYHDSGINIIVEGFTDSSLAFLAEQYHLGARFICLATEEPTDKGFNHGIQREMVERQKRFVEATPFLEGILALVPGEACRAWYGQFRPAASVELGYASTLVRKEYSIRPQYDFGFYGSLSKRRHALLRKLADRCHKEKAIRVVADFATQRERDLAMQEAKVIVQIRKHDEMGLVSSSRCNTALCIGRPVIAEPHEHSHPWDEVVRFTSSDSAFIMEALMMRDQWQEHHRVQFERFKTKFSPEICIGRALQEIGLVDGQRMAS